MSRGAGARAMPTSDRAICAASARSRCLNGHIHQIVQKVEGNITFHTARSTAYPQPQAGVGPGPGPLKVPSDQLARMLGVTSVNLKRDRSLFLTDSTLA